MTRTRQQPDPSIATLRGTGPAGPAGITATGILRYLSPTRSNAITDKSWGAAKVLWAVDSAVNGSVLVRGRQLDGPHGLRLNDPAAKELILRPKPPSTTPNGWRDYPGYTRLRAPGCYAYQIDDPSSTTVIVFKAEGPNVAE